MSKRQMMSASLEPILPGGARCSVGVRQSASPAAVRDGLQASGRSQDEFAVIPEIIVSAGDTDAERERADAGTRRLLAFYGSTPATLSDGSIIQATNVIVQVVKVTNTQTQAERTTSTDSTGSYVFSLLPVGRYTITAEAPGFVKYQLAGDVNGE